MTESKTPLRTAARNRLPASITRATLVLAWATLISNIGIMLTGGAVRLTASGLGCSEWPQCTPDSWTTTAEMGIHGAIEFGNRMLTYVLVAIAVAMLLSVIRLKETHRPLVRLSSLVLCGIPLQALIGGVTVLTQLNPWVVGLHFIVSAGLVMIATMLLRRVRGEYKAVNSAQASTPLALSVPAPDGLSASLPRIVLGAAWAAVILGTIVTGTGPHAGDPIAPRHMFDALLVTRLHVVPVYVLAAAILILIIKQIQAGALVQQRRAAWFVVGTLVFQGVIGYWQHLTGLPILLVWFHMLGSALVICAATLLWDNYNARYKIRGS